jgi:hypothetical protein
LSTTRRLTVTLAAYHGHETLTFPDYLDLGTGKTLTAEPRDEPYDVAPASGRLVPDLPADWFTALEGDDRGEGEAVPGEAAEPVPGDGEPQQF